MRALPDELTIKESKKDGLGLFARQEIIFFPHSICHIQHPYLGWLRTAVGAFLNHSDIPNCMVEEDTVTIKAYSAVTDLDLHRYLLGTSSNYRASIPVRVRHLIQCGRIDAGDEITVSYEDLNHHGIRSLGNSSLFATSQEARQAEKNYSVRVAATGEQVERVEQD